MPQLLHPVEGGARLKPLDQCPVEAVDQFQGLLAAIAVLHDCAKRLRKTGGREGLIIEAFHSLYTFKQALYTIHERNSRISETLEIMQFSTTLPVLL